MATTLNTAIVSAFDALQGFANQENFWDLFETAFGQGYDPRFSIKIDHFLS